MKRPVFILLALLVLGGATGVSAVELGRIQLERGLSKTLQVPVRIQRLTYEPGRLTLHGATFHPPAFTASPGVEVSSAIPLTIHRLQLEGSLLSLLLKRSLNAVWQDAAVQSIAVTGVTLSLGGMPLNAQGRVFLTAEPGVAARSEGWLSVEHPLFEGRVELSGPVLEPVLLGWVETLEKERFHFVSQFRLDRDALHLTRMDLKEGWQVTGFIPRAEGEMIFELSRKAYSTEPGSRFQLSLKPLPEGSGEAVLSVHQEGRMPQKLELSWNLDPEQVGFMIQMLEQQVSLNGQVSLAVPYPLDMTLNFKNAKIAEMGEWLFPGKDLGGVSGQMAGDVVCRGAVTALESEGKLSIQDGSFAGQRFESASLRFQGTGPILQVRNSHLARSVGMLLMEGAVDLRRIGQPDFFTGIRLTSMEKDFELGGWTMSPLPGSLASQLGQQRSAGGVKVRHGGEGDPVTVGWAYETDDEQGPETVNREGVEVGGSSSEKERLNLRFEGEEQFMGIEHRKKF